MAVVAGTFGSELIDELDGVTERADVIFGLGGNDTIKGGGGADTIYGGSGIDTASYHHSASAVLVNLAYGSGVGGAAEGDALISIEGVTGSKYDDVLIGNDFDNRLLGNGGLDILKGGGGADYLVGGTGNDTLYGGTGADTLDGGLGIDAMNGGAGDDIYCLDSGDIVTEAAGEGHDIVYSDANAYTLTDNVEILSLDTLEALGVYGTGNAQTNTIFGNVNDNVLEGGGGGDALSGLGGSDNFVFRPGDAHGDVVYEFEGNGAGVGDFMYFIGYGTAAQGASLVQLTASTWQINSADGLTHDVITLAGAPSVDLGGGDFVFI